MSGICTKVEEFGKAKWSSSDPINSSLSLVKIMTSDGFSDEDIVKDFLAGLCEKQ